jgi:N-acetylneuraminic acid mutarotase
MTHFWKGRIHVLAGSKEDRVTPAFVHWSLGVKDGKAIDNQWREEPPIPRGGPHRCSAVIGDELFVLGGQEGDRPPIPGDPHCGCDWKAPDETFYGDSFVLKHGGKHWRRIADMPIPATHTEFSTVVLDKSIVILGGFIGKKMITNLIQVYDTTTNTWKIIGKLPTRNKGCVAAYYQGWLYVIAGQKQAGKVNPSYGNVLKSGWRARFPLGSDRS